MCLFAAAATEGSLSPDWTSPTAFYERARMPFDGGLPKPFTGASLTSRGARVFLGACVDGWAARRHHPGLSSNLVPRRSRWPCHPSKERHPERMNGEGGARAASEERGGLSQCFAVGRCRVYIRYLIGRWVVGPRSKRRFSAISACPADDRRRASGPPPAAEESPLSLTSRRQDCRWQSVRGSSPQCGCPKSASVRHATVAFGEMMGPRLVSPPGRGR
jgi:hypothetical protein